jgi:hypothetical protein
MMSEKSPAVQLYELRAASQPRELQHDPAEFAPRYCFSIMSLMSITSLSFIQIVHFNGGIQHLMYAQYTRDRTRYPI